MEDRVIVGICEPMKRDWNFKSFLKQEKYDFSANFNIVCEITICEKMYVQSPTFLHSGSFLRKEVLEFEDSPCTLPDKVGSQILPLSKFPLKMAALMI